MKPTEFYATVCSCSNTESQCPGIVNSRTNGLPPRGFFTEVTETPIELLLVCKNPGHLLPDEALIYQGRSGRDIAVSHIDYARSTFKGNNDHLAMARRSTKFHKNLVRYIAYFLDVYPHQVFEHVAYTNLVKCSTHGERDKLQPKTMAECFTKHFIREVDFFRPKVLLAFGREVERFLVQAKLKQLHSLPVIYVKHPSYFYSKEMESKKLDEIKAEILKELSGRPRANT